MKKSNVETNLPISAAFFLISMLMASQVAAICTNPNPPTRQIVVAASGGDCQTIAEALAAITPSSSSPWVIEVMPGTYTQNIPMKSYVSLRGAGSAVTFVQPSSGNGLDLNSADNVVISGFTFKGGPMGIGLTGVGTNITIQDNRFDNNTYGIYATDGVTVSIVGNTFTGGFATTGIRLNSSSSASIIANVIKNGGFGTGIKLASAGNVKVEANVISLGNFGIDVGSGTATISGNTITGATQAGIQSFSTSATTIIGNSIIGNIGGSGYGGVRIDSSAMIVNNRITNNSPKDVDASGTPNVSFNIYDSIIGTPVGQYNVKSNGTAW